MQIQNLSIQNWKGVADFRYSPQKINVLLGPNGSGKTSILEAIKCAVNGKTPLMHVASGATGAEVSAELEKIGTINRSWKAGKASVRLNGKITTQKSIVETISEVYGFTPQTTDIMSSTDVLEGMFGKDFAAYLLGFIRNDMDVERLISLSVPSKKAEAEIRRFFPAAPQLITLDDIGNAYEHFKAKKAMAKNALSTEKVRAQCAIPEIKKSMKEVQDELAALQSEQNRYAMELRLYNNAFSTRSAQDKRVTDLEARIANIHDTCPTATEIRAASEAVQSKQALISELTAQIATWVDTRKRLQVILTNLAAPVCPISKKLICTTDKSFLSNEISAEITAAEQQIVKATELRKKAVAEMSDLEKMRMELNRRQQNYQIKQVLIGELDSLRKSLVVLPKKPQLPPSDIEQRIERLQTEKRSIEALQAAQVAAKQVEILQDSISTYDELVALFAPNGGARQKVLEHNIAPLQDYCNEHIASILPRYSLKFDVSKGFDIFVEKSGSPDLIPYKALSTGERIRVMYLLTDMLNALNGFRILILDNLDGLDKSGLESICRLILEHADDYDHVFLAAINTVEAEEVFSSILPNTLVKL